MILITDDKIQVRASETTDLRFHSQKGLFSIEIIRFLIFDFVGEYTGSIREKWSNPKQKYCND